MVKCAICSKSSRLRLTTSDGATLCDRHPSIFRCAGCLDWCEGPDTAACCSQCEFAAIRDLGALQPVAAEVRSWLSKYFDAPGLAAVSMEVVNPMDLAPGQHGQLTYTASAGFTQVVISIPAGLPLQRCQEALAHEFGHVLLIANPKDLSYRGDLGLSAYEEEGFCELLSAAWIQDHPSHNRQKRLRIIETNQFDTYREGYLMMRERLVAVGSLPTLLDSLINGGTPHQAPTSAPTPNQQTVPGRPRISVLTGDGRVAATRKSPAASGPGRPVIVVRSGEEQLPGNGATPAAPVPVPGGSRPRLGVLKTQQGE
jgi:hypothetical protein